MKTNLNINIAAIALAWVLAIVPSFAAPYGKGSKMDSFNAKDQHGEAFDFKPPAVRYLLVTHDMDTGKKTNSVLTTLGKDYLPNHKAVYLANIHGMPGVGRMFAIPKMKKYAHRIILGDDEKLIARFPEEKGKVTVIAISGGKVKSVSYWAPGESDISGYVK